MIKQTFIKLLQPYSDNPALINELWDEIEVQYSSKKRHYHNLNHLENLLICLTEIKNEISNWEAVLFSIYYHDIIYSSMKSNNEQKSAELAKKRMTKLSIATNTIELTTQHILATASHSQSTNSDTNLFTDADLSILGLDWEKYTVYFKNVRKEYAIYPNLIYNAGRKKVINHFLDMNRIFKTDYFYDRFEAQAIANLKQELIYLDS